MDKLEATTKWFLAISYGIAGPITLVLEATRHVVSSRFDLPPALIYATCVVQMCSALLLLKPRYAPWAAAALTVITVGAIGSHIRIGSPLTTIPAAVYTVIQVWYGIRARSHSRTGESI